jgi:hypothetical protein
VRLPQGARYASGNGDLRAIGVGALDRQPSGYGGTCRDRADQARAASSRAADEARYPAPRLPARTQGPDPSRRHYRSRRCGSERVRYRRIPADGSKPHSFRPPARHRHPVGVGTHTCVTCERTLRREDGPRVGACFEYAIREIAHALMRLGQGGSYRKVGRDLRRGVGRITPGHYKYGGDGEPGEQSSRLTTSTRSRDIVLAQTREPAWPDIAIVDVLPFRKRVQVKQPRVPSPIPAGHQASEAARASDEDRSSALRPADALRGSVSRRPASHLRKSRIRGGREHGWGRRCAAALIPPTSAGRRRRARRRPRPEAPRSLPGSRPRLRGRRDRCRRTASVSC